MIYSIKILQVFNLIPYIGFFYGKLRMKCQMHYRLVTIHEIIQNRYIMTGIQ